MENFWRAACILLAAGKTKAAEASTAFARLSRNLLRTAKPG
jgi:hypothetical protein